MRILLKLYPPAWRRRYEAELAALLEDQRAGTRGILDLLRGAADAWIIGPRGPLGGLGVWIAMGLFLVSTIGASLAHRLAGPLVEPFESVYQAIYWLLFIVFIWWIGEQPAARCDLSRLMGRFRR
jgi:hypothetical protein